MGLEINKKGKIESQEAKEITRYLDDFDNLDDCGFFECDDETFQSHVWKEHSNITFNEFMCKGREYIRQLYEIKKKEEGN